MKQILLLSLITILITACSDNTDQKSNAELDIYTSIYPIEYFTERIGGEVVEVNSIFPPGADAHTFEPTAKTMTNIANSDAFIYLGAGLEGFAEGAAAALENEDVQLVQLGQHEELFSHISESESDGHDHDHGHESDKDPHIWLDPLRAKKMAAHIKEKLIEISPSHEETFEQNYKALVNDLTTLHEQFEQVIQNAEQKEILVSHAAYGYWEDRYGIEQISISGLSPNSKPSQRELERLIKEAKSKQMDYIIFEQNLTDQVASIIQKEINAKPLTIHNLSVRTEQNISDNEDYISLMKQNIEVLKKALKSNPS